jgi:5-methylcytosine-specific restriction endonuclease McrA
MSRLQHKRGRKSNYAKSLNTEYWHDVRQKILVRDRCCVICTSFRNLEVHHKTYKNKGNEMENLGDLVLLCGNCHQKVHDDPAHKLNPKNN